MSERMAVYWQAVNGIATELVLRGKEATTQNIRVYVDTMQRDIAFAVQALQDESEADDD